MPNYILSLPLLHFPISSRVNIYTPTIISIFMRIIEAYSMSLHIASLWEQGKAS